LASHQQVAAEIHGTHGIVGSVVVFAGQQDFPGKLCHLEHTVAGVEVDRLLPGNLLSQYTGDPLGGGQVAGGGNHDNPLTSDLEGKQLGKCCNVVNAGIGAGIRSHDNAFIEDHSYAVGHCFPLELQWHTTVV